MKKNILLLSALLFLASASLYSAYAADAGKVLTNKDLKKYESAEKQGPNDVSVKQEQPPQRAEAAPEPPNSTERQAWCTKATRMKDRVDAAGRKVEEAQKQRNAAGIAVEANLYASPPPALLEEKLAQAKRELETAEKELADFEQTAYTQGIPPGWLRCQFD